VTGNNGTYTEIGTVSAVSANGLSVTISAAAAALTANDTVLFSGQLTEEININNTRVNGDRPLFLAVHSTDLVSTAATATAAFQVVQRAANNYVLKLGEQRSLLGAYQNQMEYTLANITELSSNLSSARSRVIDTDYASETAALTRGQILQQAATAMLAQANQMPNVILTLLK